MRYSKFGNTKIVVDGQKFDSRREADRWGILRLEEACGNIKDLERQFRYRMELNGVKICDYLCDFRYSRNGVVVVEDAKGFKTPVYRLKKKMMKAFHGIDIIEV